MRYPLNTVPINGFDTLGGSGDAAIGMEASGTAVIRKVAFGAADMMLQSVGNGSGRLLTGTGAADMAMDAGAAAILRVYCIGQAALSMDAAASPPTTQVASGQANMAMSAAADSRLAVVAAGDSAMELDMPFIPIPLPWAVPAQFNETHRTRKISIGRDDTKIEVQRDRTTV